MVTSLGHKEHFDYDVYFLPKTIELFVFPIFRLLISTLLFVSNIWLHLYLILVLSCLSVMLRPHLNIGVVISDNTHVFDLLC
jgi:hypothetical protein